jgi:hypothetical protein
MLGYLPGFLDDRNPKPAREQIDDAYQSMGGWQPFPGLTLLPNGHLKYPGDPDMIPIAETTLHEGGPGKKETVRLYVHDWVLILQEDGTYEIARVD